MDTDVIILGGGASGLAAAIEASRAGERAMILEKNDRIGRKIAATGNGRCNLMNRKAAPYGGDPEFARKVMGERGFAELTKFWESIGLKIRYDPEGRGYPATFMAGTVNECLKAACARGDVQILTGTQVTGIRKNQKGFRILTEGSGEFLGKRCILAMGSGAQPKLGAGEDGIRMLQETGHRIIPMRPALVPLITEKKAISGLEGIRIRAEIGILCDGEERHRERGEILFTESGISGICSMNCSRHLGDGENEARINMAYDLFDGIDEMARELRERQRQEAENSPTEILRGIFPGKINYAICKQAGIPLRGESAGDISGAQIRRMAETAFGYRIRITGTEGAARAQIMAGGAECSEIQPWNMESRILPGLHITGEIINIDGECGGYNLMFAAMSGIRAGRNKARP